MSEIWKQQNEHITGSCGDLSVALNSHRPHEGLEQVVWRGVPLSGRWLTLDSNLFSSGVVLSETYVRGEDLVCVYGEDSASRLSSRWEWSLREQPDTGSVALDLAVAIQTSTLDAHPQLSWQHQWSEPSANKLEPISLAPQTCEQLANETTQPLVSQDSGIQADYRWARITLENESGELLVMLHLSDWGEQTMEDQLLVQRVRVGRMEKGVIRTVRCRLLFRPTMGVADDWQREFLAFQQAALPLTT